MQSAPPKPSSHAHDPPTQRPCAPQSTPSHASARSHAPPTQRAPSPGQCTTAGQRQGSGASLHVASTPHGPDTESYDKALAADTSRPQKLEGGLAFMFETAALLTLTPHAATSSAVQPDYAACWAGLPRARVDM